MKKFFPLAFAVALPALSVATVEAAEFDPKKLHVGAGISHNVVDSPFGGRSESAPGLSFFAGYELDNDWSQVKTSVELGFDKTDDFYSGADSDIDGFWVAGVIEKDMPEIHQNLFVLARGGFDFGDDDGLLIGAGVGLHLTKHVDFRGEFINKDATSVYQASWVLNF